MRWYYIPCVIRYSAVRCQFGPTPEKELPVLEYQTQVSVCSLTVRRKASVATLFPALISSV